MVAGLTKVLIRRLRLVKFNRNLLVFLVFLCISIIFWFMQSVQETTEVTLSYKLEIEGVPKDVVYTSAIPDVVNVTYTGKGWDAFYYKFMKSEDNRIVLYFKDVNQKSGRIIVDANAIRRAVMNVKPQGLIYKSVSPGKIEAYYSNGQHKRVPVVFNGQVSTTAGRYLCDTIFAPDSVDIYASRHVYGSITRIKTAHVTFSELEDTLLTRMALLVPGGAKAVPDSVDVRLCVDIFTDKTLQVPIYSENVPRNKVIRTFPLKANVTFLVSSKLYDEITPADFLLVADYNEFNADSKRCRLHVRQRPDGIRNLRISPETVEYIIEQATE